MLLIPAIDLKQGRCVRLRQGDVKEVTVFSDNPVKVAERWVKAGARRLHIVDLDGAFEGKPMNADVINEITERFPDLPIQVGGGIRNEETVDVYIQAGVRYVIIGTRAVSEPHFIRDLCVKFPSHVIVGIDARQGKVATEGWSKLSNHDANNMAQHFEDYGVEAIIYTDILRDGMMNGVNVDATVELAESINIPVIAAGGIYNLDDVRKLAEVADSGIVGAITGRAIYEGTLDFAEGQQLADEIDQLGDFGL